MNPMWEHERARLEGLVETCATKGDQEGATKAAAELNWSGEAHFGLPALIEGQQRILGQVLQTQNLT
jgi:hypothetical protein